jgi:hypothetical protein
MVAQLSLSDPSTTSVPSSPDLDRLARPASDGVPQCGQNAASVDVRPPHSEQYTGFLA